MSNDFKNLVDGIRKSKNISKEELYRIFSCNEEEKEYLFSVARSVSDNIFHKEIYLRGLIEFTNYCKNDCYYCGIRCSNKNVERYRLSKEEILECCNIGEKLGFKTFVLQGGEDFSYSDDDMCDIISEIRKNHKECAITLSIGERTRESYKRFFDAGANRYLLRHETANSEHYNKLHPDNLSLENRKRCLYDLKEIGYQVGCGIMVGSPFQTIDNIYEDIEFMKELKPHMIGIGPFISHKDTPFKDEEDGSVDRTLLILSILRIIFPRVLLPATTALGTKDPLGREKGILAGANVLMPNLSPGDVRKKYMLYDGKICTGEEAAECIRCLQTRVEKIGYHVAFVRGDHPDFI